MNLIDKLKSLTILYIEDQPNIKKEMKKTLELFFKTVFDTEDSKTAYEIYVKNSPDMILSDVNLQGESGIDLIKRIRKNDKKTPIILLSAYTTKEYLLEASKLKLVEYLVKPITFDQLQKTLLNATKEIYDFSEMIISLDKDTKYDKNKAVIYKNNEQIQLTSSEAKLLNYFLENKNKTLSTQSIKEHIWDDPYEVTQTAFKSLLHKTRSKIGKSKIKNISGIGYHLHCE